MSKIGSFFHTITKPLSATIHGVEKGVKAAGHIVKDVATGDVKSLGKDAISLAKAPAQATIETAKAGLNVVGKSFGAVTKVAGKVIKYSPLGQFMEHTKVGKALNKATSKVGNVAYKGITKIVKYSPLGGAVALGKSGKLGGAVKSLSNGAESLAKGAVGDTLKSALTSKSFSERVISTGSLALNFVPGGSAVGAAGTVGKVASGLNDLSTASTVAGLGKKALDVTTGSNKAAKASEAGADAAQTSKLINRNDLDSLITPAAPNLPDAFPIPSVAESTLAAKYADAGDLAALGYLSPGGPGGGIDA